MNKILLMVVLVIGISSIGLHIAEPNYRNVKK